MPICQIAYILCNFYIYVSVATEIVVYATISTCAGPPEFRSPWGRQKSVRSQKSVPSCISNRPTNRLGYHTQPTKCMNFYNILMLDNLPSRICQKVPIIETNQIRACHWSTRLPKICSTDKNLWIHYSLVADLDMALCGITLPSIKKPRNEP